MIASMGNRKRLLSIHHAEAKEAIETLKNHTRVDLQEKWGEVVKHCYDNGQFCMKFFAQFWQIEDQYNYGSEADYKGPHKWYHA